MENKEKKEYGGCLSILLPLWIIGQILTIIYNLVFAGFYTDFPLIPIILIGTNVIALVGIILLLQFKKIGFYIFVLTFVITFLVGVFFPDYVKDNTIFRSIFGLGLFLLLMSFKNKETKLNGYQTLGIINSHVDTEDFASQKQIVKDHEIANTSNDFFATDIINEEEAITSENDNLEITSENIKKDNQNSVIRDNYTESPHKTKKYVYVIIPLLLILFTIVAFVLITKDYRSDQEIYNEAKALIDKKEFKEGVKELKKNRE